MDYLPKNAVLPPSPRTRERVERAAREVSAKLRALDLKDLGLSEYNHRYLRQYLQSLDAVVQRYAFILAWALGPGDMRNEEARVLLDYGGGSGLLSLLARAAGVPTVIYNDIYDVSCRDAATLGRHLDLAADEYVHGELDAVLDLLRVRDLEVDVVTNNDVIEHIYDIDTFLRRLPELSRKRLSVSLATGANQHNPWIHYRLRRLQRLREHDDRRRAWGHKEGESLRSYRSVRAGIVRERAPELAQPIVQKLAELTRGLNRDDVISAVDRYRNTGALPVPPAHPTNTCDPETSSWAEHLMDASWLRQIMAESGFEARSIPGPYGWRSHPAKRLAAQALDLAISRMRDRRAINLSAFLLVQGTRSH